MAERTCVFSFGVGSTRNNINGVSRRLVRADCAVLIAENGRLKPLSVARHFMDIPKRLIDCLNKSGISYEILHHPAAFTAQALAEAEHTKGRRHAKVVMVKSGNQNLMAVVPADHRVEIEKLEKVIGKPATLQSEKEFGPLFPDCAVGTMPAIGMLYDVVTYVDESLTEEDYIVFAAGTHKDAVKMQYQDYRQIARPRVEDISSKVVPAKPVAS